MPIGKIRLHNDVSYTSRTPCNTCRHSHINASVGIHHEAHAHRTTDVPTMNGLISLRRTSWSPRFRRRAPLRTEMAAAPMLTPHVMRAITHRDEPRPGSVDAEAMAKTPAIDCVATTQSNQLPLTDSSGGSVRASISRSGSTYVRRTHAATPMNPRMMAGSSSPASINATDRTFEP